LTITAVMTTNFHAAEAFVNAKKNPISERSGKREVLLLSHPLQMRFWEINHLECASWKNILLPIYAFVQLPNRFDC